MTAWLGVEPFLRATGPVLDVRSPAEFAQGHIPGASNLPLFTDPERAEVGLAYKRHGRQEAVRRGLELVGPKLGALGDELLARQAAGDGSPLRIHCWRGGMRSASLGWLAETLDLPVQLLEGGYKAFRHWVLACFERPWPLRLMGGRTGTGKTDLLLALARQGQAVVDLEGLAHHRGSSFGGLGLPPQPSSEQYENRLAVALDGLRAAAVIWLEAESAQVGRCRIPAALWRQMRTAPVLEIRRPLAERLRRLVAVYGAQDPKELAEATRRIARRLGPQRTLDALTAIEQGEWSEACRCMLDYYDRCYDHELARARHRRDSAGCEPSGPASAHPRDAAHHRDGGAVAVDLGDWDEARAAAWLLTHGHLDADWRALHAAPAVSAPEGAFEGSA